MPAVTETAPAGSGKGKRKRTTCPHPPFLERQKKNVAKRLGGACLTEAVEKLPRNWQSILDDTGAVVTVRTGPCCSKESSGGWLELWYMCKRDHGGYTTCFTVIMPLYTTSDPVTFPVATSYPGLYSGEYVPTDDVLARTESPLDLFSISCPDHCGTGFLWKSNRYYNQHVNERVDRRYEKQRAAGNRSRVRSSWMRKQRAKRTAKATSLCAVLAYWWWLHVCCASHQTPGRSLGDVYYWCSAWSHVRALHLQTTIRRIMENLHFFDNADPRAETDRAWKVSPVIEKLQQTFRECYNVPLVVAFDEAMIPSRSRRNIMRQYLKDKPHKWALSCL
ncbi:hypothetical protein PHMEG_00011773 [Phytophthora megakarya]|uniref:PiggyBac transposable element-derived protein domain-containing protein n=1 Tax=Phytophthora megakarya TaxID=4795 RepID=A0A225WAX6_9STRA|nr:hypothetical protein PHMEG_00011773 [Phytophthora megakarya]